MKLLIIEPNVATRSALVEAFMVYDVMVVATAQDGIKAASDNKFSAVILEMALSGHSGMEFLYEFRSYSDWQSIPVVVYTSIRLEQAVLNSPSWQLLDAIYLYKPEISLRQLKTKLEGLIK